MNALHGLCVLNTRPKEQAIALSQDIVNAGGKVIELPTLEIKERFDWVNRLPDLATIHQAIFISVNAVEHCFKQLKLHQISWPSTIEVIAVGQSSAAVLRQYGIPVSATPEIADSEHLLTLPTLQQVLQKNILLFKGQGGRTLIEETLLQRNAHLVILDVYERVIPKINPQLMKSIWRDDLVDIILLTSEQSMHNLFRLFEEDSHYWLCNKTCLVISKRLAQIASSIGMKHIILSRPDGIMTALCDYVIKD